MLADNSQKKIRKYSNMLLVNFSSLIHFAKPSQNSLYYATEVGMS